VLVPNLKNPLLEMRDFRRALCYGIDREGIVRDILLAGQAQQGFRTISGPFPAGVGLNDPVGYAYNSDLAPRPYDPRLAALLANVARTTLAKREADARKAAAAASRPIDDNKKGKDAKAPPADAGDVNTPSPKPLLLAHTADPLAKVACQAMKLQLDQIGIPIKLVELPAADPDANVAYDLLYAELAVWEPLFDARRLVGGRGVAGHASALMDAALDELDRAENLKQSQQPLKEIHRIAHYDLPLLPLWQTVNHFAHRAQLGGVGDSPVTLYQNVAEWRKSFQ
jgi:ABC-type transport system substrate-binding protein